MQVYKRFFMGFLVCILLLTGCNQSPLTETEPNNTHGISHAMGTTQVPKNPKRIVVLTSEGLEALLALGIKPVGAIKPWNGKPWYPHTASQLKGVTIVGNENQPSLEKIASLKPDLIIGNKIRQEQVYEKLSKIAPTIFSEDLRGDWKINFKLYAKTVNQEKQGEQVLAKYQQRVNQVRKKAGDLLKKEVSIIRFLSGEIRLYQADSFAGVILKDVGFARPKDQNQKKLMVPITREQLPKADADILFYFTYNTEKDQGGSQLEKEITQDPIWNNLDSVKRKHAFRVSDITWNTAGGILAAHEVLDDLDHYIQQIK